MTRAAGGFRRLLLHASIAGSVLSGGILAADWSRGRAPHKPDLVELSRLDGSIKLDIRYATGSDCRS